MDSPLLSPRASRCKRGLVFTSTLAVLALTGVIGLGLPHQSVEAQLKPDSVQTPFGRAPLSFADIVDRVKPAVVSVVSLGNDLPAASLLQQAGMT